MRLVVDLRGERERELDGAGPLASTPVVHHHVSLLDGATDPARAATLAERYLEILDRGAVSLAHILELFARSRTPAVFHCFAGKDRTGVVAAVVLGAVGVADEDIAEDYARSAPHLPAIRSSLERSRAFAEFVDRFPPDTLLAERETMAGLLADVRSRFGGVRGYLRTIGVPASTLASLESWLLE